MKKTLTFVTANAQKLEEVQALIGSEIQLKSLIDLECFDDIPETGATFEENALMKSEYIYSRYKVDCFADDSGLEIEALSGEPGIYSARYSGSRDMQENIDLVLKKLEGVTNRKANFRCVISLIIGQNKHLFEGVIHGVILEKVSGNAGFGYDPIFQPDGYSISFAEMSLEEKNKISHRSQAIAKLLAFIK